MESKLSLQKETLQRLAVQASPAGIGQQPQVQAGANEQATAPTSLSTLWPW